MLRRWRLFGPLILTLAFLTTLALHAYLGTYSRYIADDFCSAAMARRFGLLRAVWYWYLNWTGRYSASALDAVFGLLGPSVTPFMPGLVLLVWLGVQTWSTRVLSGHETKLSLLTCLGLGVSVLFVTLSLSPNVPQSLYWGQGMRSIVPPLILGVLFADLLMLFRRGRWPVGRYALWLALAFLMAFLMGGLNETYTALELSLMGFVLLLVLVLGSAASDRATLVFVGAGLLGAALSFLVVVSAPGNVYRQAYYPPPPDVTGILRIAWAGFLQFLQASFTRTDRLLAALGALILSTFFGMQVQELRPRLWIAPLALASALVFTFVCFLPAAYGLSDVPPDRTLMMPAYLIAIALVLSGFTIGSQLRIHAAAAPSSAGLEAGMLALAALACLTTVFLADRQLLESRHAYADYASNWQRMNAAIVDARSHGQTQVVVTAIPNWADLNEPNDNPKFWVNVCYREYYGIEVLAASSP